MKSSDIMTIELKFLQKFQQMSSSNILKLNIYFENVIQLNIQNAIRMIHYLKNAEGEKNSRKRIC